MADSTGNTSNFAGLVPSQAIDSRKASSSSNSNNTAAKHKGNNQGPNSNEQATPKRSQKQRRNRRNRGRGDANNASTGPDSSASKNNNSVAVDGESLVTSNSNSNNNSASSTNQPKRKRRNRGRNRPNKDASDQQQQQQEYPTSASGSLSNPQTDTGNPKGNTGTSKKKNNRNRRNKKPWRKHIPDESVDPITLESLHELPYPPFALYAEPPHDPIEIWPFPDESNNGQAKDSSQKSVVVETEEERQQRVLREQWGDQLTVSESLSADDDDKDEDKKPAAKSTTASTNVENKTRHVHLYDGRALAYYMVSQLQFIDPLNRRDLTREELVSLDRYLRRHGFSNLNVTEAYDEKGVSISKAGSAATTAAGRAAILQQEAAVLLNALFGGPSTGLPNRSSNNGNHRTPNTTTNSLAASYQAYENSQQAAAASRSHSAREDTGIYGDSGGILVIDDDINPGLRGNNIDAALNSDAPEFVPGGTTPNLTRWSANQIASRMGHRAQVQAAEFPALAKPTASSQVAASSSSATTPKKPLPKSNTLSKIATSVKKTDPEERQRMWEAHEEFIRRSRVANLTFNGNAPPAATTNDGPPIGTISVVDESNGPTDAQLERNRVFAQALGVKPSTVRHSESGGSLNSGWARPTDSLQPQLDEFGNELNNIVYPDELILEARERLAMVVKLERRWKLFLEDDKAASLPLWPMDRPTRVFVHQYSDFWKLNTESFDPEPKRYIHCVKLLDTMAPCPLLSDAARNWKGPSAKVTPSIVDLPRHSKSTSQQAAGEATTQEPAVASRWDDLDTHSKTPPKTRPKLELQKRTLPTELPPMEKQLTPSDFFSEKEREARKQRMEEKARKEREAAEAKRRALEAAFASDDEEESSGSGDDDGSEWTAEEQQYVGGFSDEEE